MSKIAAVVTNYFEDSEYTEPAKAFQDAQHQITVISTEKGQSIKGKQGKATITSDLSIAEANPNDYDALFIPGGFSPDQLRGDTRFVEFTKHFMDNNKPVFAICHGPQLLITAETLKGRTATGYKSIQVDMKNAGVNFKDQEVVIDGNLVTSRQPDDIPAFNKASLEVLQQQFAKTKR